MAHESDAEYAANERTVWSPKEGNKLRECGRLLLELSGQPPDPLS